MAVDQSDPTSKRWPVFSEIKVATVLTLWVPAPFGIGFNEVTCESLGSLQLVHSYSTISSSSNHRWYLRNWKMAECGAQKNRYWSSSNNSRTFPRTWWGNFGCFCGIPTNIQGILFSPTVSLAQEQSVDYYGCRWVKRQKTTFSILYSFLDIPSTNRISPYDPVRV